MKVFFIFKEPMNPSALQRSFHLPAIFILGLYTAASAFHYHLFLKAGRQTYGLPSFVSWMVLFVLLQLAASVVMLRFYHYRRYWLPFSLELLVIGASLCQYFILYQLFIVKTTNNRFYIPAAFVVMGANTLYGVALLFTRAGKRPFLRAAGGLSVLLGGILLFAVAWMLNTQDAQLKLRLEKAYIWASWAGLLIPVLFGLNFWRELEEPGDKTETTSPGALPLRMALNTLMAAAAVTALVFAVRLGYRIDREAVTAVQPTPASTMEEAMAQRFEAHTYVNRAGDTLRYRLMKPLHFDPARKYPLVVCLHHGGAHGTDNVRQVENSDAPFLAHYLNREKYPAFLFVPQCPQEFSWQSPAVEQLVMEAIGALEEAHPIDVSRRYVMGTSGGGYGTWHLTSTHPGVFAAAIPRCGTGNPALAPNLVNLPVWAFHGEKDESVPVRGSREMIAAIRKAGGHPRYTEFPDAGHDIHRAFEETPGVLDWLFAQQRK
jgi:predicted esterase